jgi:cytochrome b involved in lipid metabolism
MSTAQAQLPQYTIEQVAEHNSDESLWIVVDGKVYDVTEFASEHPGGQKALQNHAGQDATQAFNSISKHGLNSGLPDFMKTMHVGNLKSC